MRGRCSRDQSTHPRTRLVNGDGLMIVVERNLDVVAHADWVIDLGSDGGDAGGAVE